MQSGNEMKLQSTTVHGFTQVLENVPFVKLRATKTVAETSLKTHIDGSVR